MIQSRTLIAMGLVSGCLFAGAFFLSPAPQQVTKPLPKMAANLLNHANEIATIEINSPEGPYQIKQNDNGWEIPSLANYPVADDRIKDLVLSLIELKTLEKKTANPDYFSELNLEESNQPNKQSTQVAIKNQHGKLLADLLIGKKMQYPLDRNLKKIFIRKSAEPQSWLTLGSLPKLASPLDWVDTRLIPVQRATIKSVAVYQNNNNTFSLSRASADTHFALENINEGYKLAAQEKVDQLPYGFSELNFTNVYSQAVLDSTEKPVYTAKLTTFNGLLITMKQYLYASQPVIKLHAALDLAAAGDTLTTRETSNQVEILNKNYQRWVYALPAYQASIFKQQSTDLIEKING